MDFTLRQLQYAVAVADLRSFRAAAARCHVSQPALSAQIQQLESMLEVRLFERDKRRVLITPAGANIVQRARKLLAEANDLTACARSAKQGLHGRLRLGVIPTIAPYVLPRVLPAMLEHYPDMQAVLREDRTPLLLAALRSTELDLLLVAREADLGDVATAEVAADPFVLVLPTDHRLAKRKRVREQDLLPEELLVLEDGHCLGDQSLMACGVRSRSDTNDLRGSSLGTLMQMVAQGLGVTLLPAVAVAVESAAVDLRFIPFTKSGPARTIVLAWRRSSPFEASYRALAKQLAAWWP